ARLNTSSTAPPACSACGRRRGSGCPSSGSSLNGAPTSTATARWSRRNSSWRASGCPRGPAPSSPPSRPSSPRSSSSPSPLGPLPTHDQQTPAAQLDRAMELRTLAEFTLRNRLLAVEGVAQVTVMGGVLKQYQIVTNPHRLLAQNVTLQQLVEAAEKANVLSGAGIVERSARESLIRISGQ